MTMAKRLYGAAGALLATLAPAFIHQAWAAPQPPAPAYGPFDTKLVSGGAGVAKPLRLDAPLLRGAAPFTLTGWIKGQGSSAGPVVLASIGEPSQPEARQLGIVDGRLFLASGSSIVLTASEKLPPGPVAVAATFDGRMAKLYVNGRLAASGPAIFPTVPPPPPPPENAYQRQTPPELNIAPLVDGAGPNQHFAGTITGLSLYDDALTPADLRALAAHAPAEGLLGMDQGAKPWPVQLRQQAGYDAPQDPATLPQSNAPYSKPVAKPAYAGPALKATAANAWTLMGGWRLIEAPRLRGTDANGAALSTPGYDASSWYAATVPGTVLTTLVDRGVYPDPSYGLNNLAIPESLNKQDYWYRTQIDAPAATAGRRLELTFNGINYAAEVWLNGQRLGDIKGAFIRGSFDVTGLLKPGQPNALAVRISPPPHPGIPQEQSIAAGVGENGGLEMLDGPTFGATEGWDWIPGVRDRNTGIWQDVTLKATGEVRIEDPQVVTTLPLPDRSQADLNIKITLDNLADHPVSGQLHASFDAVSISKTVTLGPGLTTIALTPAEFAQLHVANPRLWWPNGYGEAALHDLHLSFDENGATSDAKSLRFGIREITYELSAFDQAGQLRRVEIDPAKTGGRQVIDGDHEHIHKTAKAYAVSLHPGAETAPGVTRLPDDPLSPFLVLKVNGVRIAVRGGAWGMDDFMKRVSRERLEPYFRLNKEAHLNIARNWVGQDTEEAFYDLADEYGILVWNDFWESTQDYNLEAQDPALFLKNAADVISRFRNHASVAIWIGRNEGMPQPILNEGLEKLTRTLDGTRYYAGSSNRINLQDSGPYNYRAPGEYFTTLSHGFAVEVGTPSFSSLEAFKASVAPADQWPVNDVWAYHDWHQSGNGDTKTFMAALTAKFGAPSGLDDFERKAQMLQYESHRAIFEGMNAHLWTLNSGRMLWMIQPAWPSNNWQIYTSDYDTAAPYYGVKKASETVHVQMNLPDFQLAVINTTLEPLSGAVLEAKVFSLDGHLISERRQTLAAAADAVTNGEKLDLAGPMSHGPVIVKLQLQDAAGRLLSDNVYWQAAKDADLNQLSAMARDVVAVSATSQRVGEDVKVLVRLENRGVAPALANKLTLEDSKGMRILPAFYDDNYVTLMPGETRDIAVRYPASASAGGARIALRGWNAEPSTTKVR
jgi:hypothetical protein